jgi:hypothetical protein
MLDKSPPTFRKEEKMAGRLARMVISTAVLAGAVVALGAVPAQAAPSIRIDQASETLYYDGPAMTNVIGIFVTGVCSESIGTTSPYFRTFIVECGS